MSKRAVFTNINTIEKWYWFETNVQ